MDTYPEDAAGSVTFTTILLAVTDAAPAERFYPQFKWSVIAPIEADRWALDAGDVLDWLGSAAAGTDGVVPVAVET